MELFMVKSLFLYVIIFLITKTDTMPRKRKELCLTSNTSRVEYDDRTSSSSGIDFNKQRKFQKKFKKRYDQGHFRWPELENSTDIKWEKWRIVCLNAWKPKKPTPPGCYNYCLPRPHPALLNSQRYHVDISLVSENPHKLNTDVLFCECLYYDQKYEAPLENSEQAKFYIVAHNGTDYYKLIQMSGSYDLTIIEHVLGEPDLFAH